MPVYVAELRKQHGRRGGEGWGGGLLFFRAAQLGNDDPTPGLVSVSWPQGPGSCYCTVALPGPPGPPGQPGLPGSRNLVCIIISVSSSFHFGWVYTAQGAGIPFILELTTPWP
ncbi:hypothetical protein GHT09_003489 [Marmota monax]|uniref:Uncharacterized protein n=1 Tax=Marmota monax TaxID=9995 RepID=A0A834PZG5_MARMO|nr:hypothetical protein GHT09_003489 [Marmota monax]